MTTPNQKKLLEELNALVEKIEKKFNASTNAYEKKLEELTESKTSHKEEVDKLQAKIKEWEDNEIGFNFELDFGIDQADVHIKKGNLIVTQIFEAFESAVKANTLPVLLERLQELGTKSNPHG